MQFEAIKEQIEKYQKEGKRLFSTCSFQTHSLVLLHIISRIDKKIPVYFINTGFLFPETVQFKQQLTKQFELNVIDIQSATPKNMQMDDDGRFYFTSDPDFCCYLNKTQPLDAILMQHDVWINGIRADQSAVRKAMQIEQPAPHGTIRYHPMLDWTSKDIYTYIKDFNLPKHPLENSGYSSSIGCEPCTRKISVDMQEREARWFGLKKVECGLHTELVVK